MNTPKLPPLPPQRRKVFRTPIGPVEVWAYGEDDMQAYAIAAIEAQGVPDGWREFVQRVAGQKPEKPDYWSACGQCERNISDAEDLLASAPPAPQAEDDSAASVNDTNAVLAGRYFELLKVVEQYEKSGVTCQTFRHFISEP